MQYDFLFCASVVDAFGEEDLMPSELGKSLNWTPEGGYAEDIADKLITPKTAAGNFFPFFFPNLMNVLY